MFTVANGSWNLNPMASYLLYEQPNSVRNALKRPPQCGGIREGCFITITTVWRFWVNFWVIFWAFFSQRIG